MHIWEKWKCVIDIRHAHTYRKPGKVLSYSSFNFLNRSASSPAPCPGDVTVARFDCSRLLNSLKWELLGAPRRGWEPRISYRIFLSVSSEAALSASWWSSARTRSISSLYELKGVWSRGRARLWRFCDGSKRISKTAICSAGELLAMLAASSGRGWADLRVSWDAMVYCTEYCSGTNVDGIYTSSLPLGLFSSPVPHRNKGREGFPQRLDFYGVSRIHGEWNLLEFQLLKH